MTKGANDNEPLAVGDRVQHRRLPHLQGYVWSMENIVTPGRIIVKWDDGEESSQPHPRDLQKLTPPSDRGA
jgi:hypothetical protein